MAATAQDAVPDDIGALRAALTAALARAEDEAARAALLEAELASPGPKHRMMRR